MELKTIIWTLAAVFFIWAVYVCGRIAYAFWHYDDPGLTIAVDISCPSCGKFNVIQDDNGLYCPMCGWEMEGE